MHSEQAVQLLSEYILRHRRPTKKGEIAQAFIEVIDALRVIAKVPCERCSTLRRELVEAREQIRKLST